MHCPVAGSHLDPLAQSHFSLQYSPCIPGGQAGISFIFNLIFSFSFYYILLFIEDWPRSHCCPYQPGRQLQQPVIGSHWAPFWQAQVSWHPAPYLPAGHVSLQVGPPWPMPHWQEPVSGSQTASSAHLHTPSHPEPKVPSGQAVKGTDMSFRVSLGQSGSRETYARGSPSQCTLGHTCIGQW